EAIDILQLAGAAPFGGSSAAVAQRLGELAVEAAEQGALVEAVQSDNALLQNSLAYFTHASRGLSRDEGMASEVGGLVNAMLQFMRDPQEEIGAEVGAALDRLNRPPDAQGAAEADTLVAHARLILSTLPEVDASLGHVLNGQM